MPWWGLLVLGQLPGWGPPPAAADHVQPLALPAQMHYCQLQHRVVVSQTFFVIANIILMPRLGSFSSIYDQHKPVNCLDHFVHFYQDLAWAAFCQDGGKSLRAADTLMAAKFVQRGLNVSSED